MFARVHNPQYSNISETQEIDLKLAFVNIIEYEKRK